MKIIGAHGLTDEIGLSVVNVICVFFTLFLLDIFCDCFLTFGNCIFCLLSSDQVGFSYGLTEHLWHTTANLNNSAFSGLRFLCNFILEDELCFLSDYINPYGSWSKAL